MLLDIMLTSGSPMPADELQHLKRLAASR